MNSLDFEVKRPEVKVTKRSIMVKKHFGNFEDHAFKVRGKNLV